jgi:hypothetical protein
MMVRGRTGRLNDVAVFAPNILVDFNEGFPIREFADRALAKRDADACANRRGEFDVGIARKYFHRK